MPKVFVVYASRHGGTRGIAERIGEVLRAEGVAATVESTDDAGRNVGGADAYVVGSGVYMGSWLKEGTEFLARHRKTLATRPTWLFSSGPLRGSTAGKPGSKPPHRRIRARRGSRKRRTEEAAELGTAIRVQEHRIFYGAFDPSDPPKAFSERLVRLMPVSTSILPPGDFREWDAIEEW